MITRHLLDQACFKAFEADSGAVTLIQCLGSGVMPLDAVRDQELCANQQGFSLHAAVRCDADERQRLKQLCRTITRPALANERVQINSAGQVVLQLKTAWRDGTTHIVMSPLEFMQGLALDALGQVQFKGKGPRCRYSR